MVKKNNFKCTFSGRFFFLFILTFFLSACFAVLLFGHPAFAQEEEFDLSDVPLEIRGMAAPGLVNLVWDASGSMLFTIFTETDDYLDEYIYVFPEANRYYPDQAGFRTLPENMRNHWQTQYAGENRMYYNPDVTYDPWPRWNKLEGHELDPEIFHADPDTPRQHPIKVEYPTFELNARFATWPVGEEVIDIEAVGIIVDNADSDAYVESGEGNYRWWNVDSDTNPNANQAYNENYRHTYRSGNLHTATWAANDLEPGEYYVFARWVEDTDRYGWPRASQSVQYTIDHSEGSSTVYVDQQKNGGIWNLLAKGLSFNGSGTVTLSHTPTYRDYDRAYADAVLFVPADEYPTADIIFAHYFTRNNNGETFLVNLDGGFQYYRAILGDYEDDDDNKIVERLLEMTIEEASQEGIVPEYSYQDARQNFADWYQFYRRRYYTGIAAAGTFINDWTNIFMRITSFPQAYGNHDNIRRIVSPIEMTIVDLEGNEDYFDEKDDVLWDLYTMNHPWGDTPLRQGLYEAGRFFEFGVDWSDLLGTSPFRIYSNEQHMPYFAPEYGGECQQGFAIVMTDGMWNGDMSNSDLNIIGNADGDNTTDFDGGVFGDSYSHTAADIAMHFYERDLHPYTVGADKKYLNNFVPTNDIDQAKHQHMVTYAISFGIPGSFTEEERQEYAQDLRYGDEPDSWPGWTEPESGKSTTIDDLWHATINGRGDFVSAASPQELITAMDRIKSDIESRLGSASAVATNSVQRRTDTNIYQAIYHPAMWSGDLVAKAIDIDTGAVGDTVWSARQQLEQMNWQDRNIYTYNGSSMVDFNYSVLSQAQKDLLVSELADTEDIVDFLRGDQSMEKQNGGPLRNRDSILGDIVHSEPVYNNGIIYTGANDGMLHAFDASSGEELFAYVPNIVFDHLADLADPYYTHQYYVDGTPVVRKAGDKTVLVGGLNKGGKGYYALDVTDAESGSIEVMWEYTTDSQGGGDLGYSYSRPVIIKTAGTGETGRWVVAFGNGYNSSSQEAAVYILDIDSGTHLKTLYTGISGLNGIVARVAPVDDDLDGNVDYMYAGDLKGNLWKFDLSDATTAEWDSSYKSGTTPMPFFTAKNDYGENQHITVTQAIMGHCDSWKKGNLVFLGTGKYVTEYDLISNETQTIYGLWDWQESWEYHSGPGAGDNKYLGEFTVDRQLTNASGLTLARQEIETWSENWAIISDNEVDWWDPENDSGSHVGWYLDLPQIGERVINNPSLFTGILEVIGSIPTNDPCTGGGRAMVYRLNPCTGGEPEGAMFDTDGDGQIDDEDLIEVDGELRSPGGLAIDQLIFSGAKVGDETYYSKALFGNSGEEDGNGGGNGGGGSDDDGSIVTITTPDRKDGMMYWLELD